MKLILIVAVLAIGAACLPFVLLWQHGGRFGPALAAFLAAGVIAGGGFYVLPAPETWPPDKSGLQHMTGTVTGAKRVTYGGSFSRYELTLDGPVQSASILHEIPADNVRAMIGQRVVAGCVAHGPGAGCPSTLVHVESGGQTLLDYADTLKARQRNYDASRGIVQMVFAAAGVAAAFGLGLGVAQLFRRAD